MGISIVNYRPRYNALSRPVKRKVCNLLKHWNGWTDATVLRKISGMNLNRVEKIVLDGVFEYCEDLQNKQQELIFEWHRLNGLQVKK